MKFACHQKDGCLINALIVISAAILLTLTFAAPLAADTFEDAKAAHASKDYVTALRLCRSLANQGHAGAQNMLGVMYAKGDGVPQDYAEAAKWYRLSAEQGWAKAQYNLGAMYAKGDGVPQDWTCPVFVERLGVGSV